MGAEELGIMALVMAAAGTGASVYEQSQMPTPHDPLPVKNDQATIAAAAAAQAEAMNKRRGFASTILTGPQGAMGAPSTGRATLGT